MADLGLGRASGLRVPWRVLGAAPAPTPPPRRSWCESFAFRVGGGVGGGGSGSCGGRSVSQDADAARCYGGYFFPCRESCRASSDLKMKSVRVVSSGTQASAVASPSDGSSCRACECLL